MVTGKKIPMIDYKKKFNQAIRVMNKKNLGIVVVNKNRFIKGLITDGDIRRVLNSSEKQKSLDKIIRKYPLVISENMPASKALAIMNEKKITSLCVYEKKKKFFTIGILHIHNILNKKIY